MENWQALMFLLPISLLYLTAVLGSFGTVEQTSWVKKLSSLAIISSVLAALIGCVVIWNSGTIEAKAILWENLGLSVRIDVLSIVLFSMISMIGFVVVKYSYNYLDGDDRQHLFIGNLSATLASVLVFVLSGNLLIMFLAWVSMSLALHQLLIFYHNRIKANIAARKKFIVARLGDIFILLAFVLLYQAFGTGEINEIITQIKSTSDFSYDAVNAAAIFLVLAAAMKSAQFPFHGWLVEVMETPTPVSATLHAGLINAGPFLMIQMSYLLQFSTAASVLLIIIGSISAIFGAIAFTTQPAQKTALAYSSIAHMGFSLITSGIGLYAAAALHLVAHSFYKGHSFLSSGTAVDTLKLKKIPSSKRKGSILHIALSAIIVAMFFAISVQIWQINFSENLAFLAISAVVLSASILIVSATIDANNYRKTMLKSCVWAFFIINCFFGFETGAHHILEHEIAPIQNLFGTKLWVVSVAFTSFVAIIALQIISPLLPKSKLVQQLGIHFRNGLYINAYADRWLGSFQKEKKRKAAARATSPLYGSQIVSEINA